LDFNVEPGVPRSEDAAYWILKRHKEQELYRRSTKLGFGIHTLDRRLQLYGKKLAFIVARSSYGKTSFAAHMMRHQIREGHRILFCSCEEAGEYFIGRMLCNGKFPVDRLFMIDDSKLSLQTVINEFIYLSAAGYRPDIIYIDQLNKMVPEVPYRNKHEKIVAVVEDLQGLVKGLGVPVVILHQANREAERVDHFLTQEHIADADAVFSESQLMLIVDSLEFKEWKKHKEDPNQYKFEYRINIAKNRTAGGWEGFATVQFDRNTGIFHDDPGAIFDA